MADLGLLLYPFPDPAPPPLFPGGDLLGGGHNPEQAIIIGSSDDEDEDAGPPRASIEEQRARVHNNRAGTPLPGVGGRDNFRVRSPPPPLPFLDRPPLLPRGPRFETLQQLLASDVNPNLHRYVADAERHFERIMDLFMRNRGELGRAKVEEYDSRMTHARDKPRIGFTYDFAPDEEAEATPTKETKPLVKTRTTIIIPDSPPVRPVDRKGKARAIDPDEVLDLEEDVGSSSKKKRAVEVVEVLSDDESDFEVFPIKTEAAAPVEPDVSARTVLVCGSCRRPLRMGGDRLWALRCGHMIDSRCYKELAEKPIVPQDIPLLADAETKRPTKKRRTRKGKGKAKAQASANEPVETIEYTCPVPRCKRVHWSHRFVEGGWRPAEGTGAIAVFV